ncbi:MAG: hypothetical protein ACE5K0_04250 [Candidatus Methanofastidiosia archaeon]
MIIHEVFEVEKKGGDILLNFNHDIFNYLNIKPLDELIVGYADNIVLHRKYSLNSIFIRILGINEEGALERITELFRKRKLNILKSEDMVIDKFFVIYEFFVDFTGRAEELEEIISDLWDSSLVRNIEYKEIDPIFLTATIDFLQERHKKYNKLQLDAQGVLRIPKEIQEIARIEESDFALISINTMLPLINIKFFGSNDPVIRLSVCLVDKPGAINLICKHITKNGGNILGGTTSLTREGFGRYTLFIELSPKTKSEDLLKDLRTLQLTQKYKEEINRTFEEWHKLMATKEKLTMTENEINTILLKFHKLQKTNFVCDEPDSIEIKKLKEIAVRIK